MNKGRFKGKKYTKYVDFSKAVLWKDRQLSIPRFIYIGLDAHKTEQLEFIDIEKGEKWVFQTDDVKNSGEWKAVGQEEQLYFPIELADKEKLN